MSDVVEKCRRALLGTDIETFGAEAGVLAIIDALAESVSEGMSKAVRDSLSADGFNRPMNDHKIRRALRAAILAAKG